MRVLVWVLVWALVWVVVRLAVVLVMLLPAFSGEACCEALWFVHTAAPVFAIFNIHPLELCG